MGSDGFAVDLDALGAARDRVGRLADELPGQSRDVPDAAAFGHDRLAAAVTEFTAQEKQGLTRLATEAESIRDGLAGTVRAYQKVDEDSAGRLKGLAP